MKRLQRVSLYAICTSKRKLKWDMKRTDDLVFEKLVIALLKHVPNRIKKKVTVGWFMLTFQKIVSNIFLICIHYLRFLEQGNILRSFLLRRTRNKRFWDDMTSDTTLRIKKKHPLMFDIDSRSGITSKMVIVNKNALEILVALKRSCGILRSKGLELIRKKKWIYITNSDLNYEKMNSLDLLKCMK